MFAFGSQAFTAGRQDMQVRGAAQQRFAELSRGVDQMLAIIDHQQQMSFLELAGNGSQWIAVRLRQVQQGAQVWGDHDRIVEQRQIQQISAVAVAIDQPLGDPQGHSGLADATGTDQGNEAFARQMSYQAVHYRLASDHPGTTRRQIVGQ